MKSSSRSCPSPTESVPVAKRARCGARLALAPPLFSRAAVFMKPIIAARATPRPPKRIDSLHNRLRKILRAQAREQAIPKRRRLDRRSQMQSRMQRQAQQAVRLALAVMENQARQLHIQAANRIHPPNAAQLRPANLAHQLSAEIPPHILLAEILLAPQQGQTPPQMAQNHPPLPAQILQAMRHAPRHQPNNTWLPKPCTLHALAAAKATCAARKSDQAGNAACNAAHNRKHTHHTHHNHHTHHTHHNHQYYLTHNLNHHHTHTPHPQTISQIDSSNATQIY